MATTTTRWGICGTGKISSDFCVALVQTPGALITAVAASEGHLTRGQTFAATFTAKQQKQHEQEEPGRPVEGDRGQGGGLIAAVDGYAELAARTDVDVVYVGTVNSSHYATTLMLIEAGKNVVCEKPMGLNGAEVEALSAAARAQGTFLMEGLWSRFLPAVVALRGVLDAGTLGEVVAVHGDFGFVCDDPPSSRMFDPALGGGGLLDIGIYPLAFASMAFKGAAPSRVAAAGTLHPATGVDTSAGITCTFPSPGGGGGQGGLSIVTYNLRGHTPEDMVFVGTKGRATLKGPAHVATTLLLTVPDGRTGAVAEEVREFPLPPRDPEHAYLYPGSEGFKFEIEEVQRCLAEKRTESPRYTHEEMVNIARTMDEVRKQLGVVYPADAHKPKIAAASAAAPPPPEVVAVAAGGHE